MRQDRTCTYCDTFFPNVEGKVFANHIRWCDKNTTNGDKGISKTKKTSHDSFVLRAGDVKDFSVMCQRCQLRFVVKEREKRHPEREVYYCSRSCANSRGPRTEDFKKKISHKLSGRILSERVTKSCLHCNKQFETTIHDAKKCCSVSCSLAHRYRHVDREGLKYYRGLCSFKFNLADYPDEFDFSLIEQHGWYAAKNHGDNLGGVSRDHMISIRYGYEKGIDPEVISHPANCQLLVHGSNVSKGKKCDMTIEQLQQKIVEWNEKYRYLVQSLKT